MNQFNRAARRCCLQLCNVAVQAVDMLQRSREAALAVPSAKTTSGIDKLLDPDRNNEAVAVRKAAARWEQLTTALDLKPAPCNNLTKLLLKGNSFSTAGVVQLMDALETNRTGTALFSRWCVKSCCIWGISVTQFVSAASRHVIVQAAPSQRRQHRSHAATEPLFGSLGFELEPACRQGCGTSRSGVGEQ